MKKIAVIILFSVVYQWATLSADDLKPGFIQFTPMETDTIYSDGLSQYLQLQEVHFGWYYDFEVFGIDGDLIINNFTFTPNPTFWSYYPPNDVYRSLHPYGYFFIYFEVDCEDQNPADQTVITIRYKRAKHPADVAESQWYYETIAIGTDQPTVSVPSLICYSGSQVSISNYPPGFDIFWEKSSNLRFIGSNEGSTVTVAASTRFTHGSGWVRPMYDGACGELECETQAVWVGQPNAPTDISFSPPVPCLNQLVIGVATVNNPSISGTHYYWRGTHTYYDGNVLGSETHFTTLPTLYYTANVYVKGTNTCGSSMEYYELLTVDDCGGGVPASPIIVNPNPASTYIDVAFDEEKLDVPLDEYLSAITSSKYTNYYRIIDPYGEVKITGIYKGEKEFRVIVSELPLGIYYLQMILDNQASSITFMISK